jgi:hypothetical protein
MFLMAIQFDPFRTSALTRSATMRVALIALVVGALWAAIAWAVALP